MPRRVPVLRCWAGLVCAWALLLGAWAPPGARAGEEEDRMAEMFGGKQFGRGKEKKAPAVKADLPFIRCSACEAIVEQALLSTHYKQAGRAQAQEADILEDLESMCDPDSDSGEWITKIDLLEEGSQLTLKPMGIPGECGSECRTIARSCETLMEEADLVEFSQALWKASRRSMSLEQKLALSDLLCKDQTNACKRKTPPLPKGRSPGPAFKPLTSEDLSLRNTMRGLRKAGMGGTLFNKDQIMGMKGMGGMDGEAEAAEEL